MGYIGGMIYSRQTVPVMSSNELVCARQRKSQACSKQVSHASLTKESCSKFSSARVQLSALAYHLGYKQFNKLTVYCKYTASQYNIGPYIEYIHTYIHTYIHMDMDMVGMIQLLPLIKYG